jgi:hypothetical protein
MKKFAAFLCLFAVLSLQMKAGSPSAQKGFVVSKVILYQGNDILESRVPEAKELAGYIKQLQQVATEYFASADKPETFHIVVGLRPGKRVHIWFDSSTRTGELKDLAPLEKKLEAVPSMEVTGGPVFFALSGNIAGGDGKLAKGDGQFLAPLPYEWEKAAKGVKPAIPVEDSYFDLVWPVEK